MSSKRRRRCVRFSSRSLDNAHTFSEKARGAIIRSRLWSVSAHAGQRKDLSSSELEFLRRSRNPHNGNFSREVPTNEEARAYVHDLHLRVSVQLPGDTLVCLVIGKLCEEHGYTHEWVSGQEAHLTTDGKSILCKAEISSPFVVPEFSSSSGTSSSSTSPPQVHRVHGIQQFYQEPREHQEIGAREQRETACRIFRRGWMTSQKISRTQKCQHPQPSLMTQIRNDLKTWHQGSSVFIFISRKTNIAKSASEPRFF